MSRCQYRRGQTEADGRLGEHVGEPVRGIAWVVWLASLAGPGVPLGLWLAGIDDRWRPAILLASFRTVLVRVGFGLVVLSWALATFVAGPPIPLLVLSTWVLGYFVLFTTVERREQEPDPDGGRIPVRMVTLNVDPRSPDPAAVARQLRALDADVVLVQEYTPEHQRGFHDEGMPTAYPHHFEAPLEGWFGSAVFSRLPIGSATVVTIGERPMIVCSLKVGGTTVTLADLHIQAPMRDEWVAPWRAAYVDLERIVVHSLAAGRPVVLAGDWNSTAGHVPFRRLLSSPGLYEPQHGGRPTWPVGRSLPPMPVLELDHIVLSRSVGCRSVEVVAIDGTDHRGLLAELEI